MTGVDRAVRSYERVSRRLAPLFAIPPGPAAELGLRSCAACGHPIDSGDPTVRYRRALYHAGCAAELVRAAA